MRIPKSISPSGLAKFEKDRVGYYFNYMAEPRPPRDGQNHALSIGSAFDAYVKHHLLQTVCGDTTLSFGELFESQVDSEHRDWALGAGRYAFESYKASGALDDLVDLMSDCHTTPQFEFDASRNLDGIPLIGKPDCKFVHKSGLHVILDWKVNGFCSKKSAVSPHKGYMVCRDGLDWEKPSRSHMKSHELFKPIEMGGIILNEYFMEEVSIDWADQLTMYSWMVGEEVGDENTIVCIDQVVGKPNGEYPLLRFASHRARVSNKHQVALMERLKTMWDAVSKGNPFYHLTEKEQTEVIAKLDKKAVSMKAGGSPLAKEIAKFAQYQGVFYQQR